jgi:hypothetical protein
VNKSTKAALLSAFVFPGVGHIYLKKYILGVVLAGASLAALAYLVSKVVERAFEISEKIQNGEVQLDVAAITELVSKQSSGTDAQLLNMVAIALVMFWLIGIIDSYRVGWARGKKP